MKTAPLFAFVFAAGPVAFAGANAVVPTLFDESLLIPAGAVKKSIKEMVAESRADKPEASFVLQVAPLPVPRSAPRVLPRDGVIKPDSRIDYKMLVREPKPGIDPSFVIPLSEELGKKD